MKKYLKLIKTNVKKIKINIYDLELQKKIILENLNKKILKKVKKKNKTKHSKLLYSVMMLP